MCLMLVQIYDVVAVTVIALGATFLLVWAGDHLNRSALCWGVAHLALGVASLTGYHYQESGSLLLAVISVLMTATALVGMWSATFFLLGRDLASRGLVLQTAGLTVLIILVASSGPPWAARALINALFVGLYAVSAYLFYFRLDQRWAGGAFLFEALAFLVKFADWSNFSTQKQNVYIFGVQWCAHLLLALSLVFFASSRSRRFLDQIMQNLPDAVLATKPDGTILFCNEAYARLSGGRSPGALAGQRVQTLSADPERAELVSKEMKMMAESTATGTSLRVEREFRPVEAPPFPAEMVFSNYRDFGQVVILAQIRDLTERKKSEERIHDLAFFDQQTALPNRRLVFDRLQQAMAGSARSGSFGALLFIDLDNFKGLNETLGHEMGDEFLKQIAGRLLNSVRECDTVGRLGGDEFVVILSGLGVRRTGAATWAKAVADKILVDLSQPCQLGQLSYQTTSSIGVALLKGTQISVEDLLKQAELTLYSAKSSGRNAIHFFDPELETALKQRNALEIDLRLAIESKQLVLHYQPQIDSGRIVGAEALVRWPHSLRGLVSPAEFIPLAEESGLILPLGHLVLEIACSQLALWAEHPDTAPLTIAVNVSAEQFRQADFVGQVLSVLQNAGANPQRLKLELTESLLVHDVEELIKKMNALKAEGVGFALDDFGTGYSSLAYLKRLPIDQLKIDQSFVRDVLLDANDAVIARTIVALANSLGLGVIAEGVETEAQRDFLESSGCHAYQGYFCSRPLPIADFEIYTARQRRI